MKILGKIIICLVGDKMMSKVMWSILKFYPNQTKTNFTNIFIFYSFVFLDPILV